MINNWSDCDIDDVELLKHGRNYWVNIRRERKDTKSTKALIIVGRNKEDNKTLENLAKKGDLLVELKDEVGPVSLIRDKKQEINIKEISNFKFQIPDNVNIKDFKLDENKNDEELVKIAGLLTGYHAPKARGREVNFKLRIIN